MSRRPSPSRVSLPSAILALAGTCLLAGAAGSQAPDENDDVEANLLRAAKSEFLSHAPVLREFDEARTRWRKAIGLEYSVTYYAYAAGIMLGDEPPSGGSGEIALLGTWSPTMRWVENPVSLSFRIRDRRAFGRLAPASLGDEVGTLWGIADGFTDAGFQVPDFFFQHEFSRAGIELRYGQMTLDSQFDSYALSGSKQSFLNQAFASHPGVAFPSYGAGVSLMKTFDNGFGVGVGASNVQGTPGNERVDLKFTSDDLFECARFSYDFKACGTRASRAELLLWHSDALDATKLKQGQGASLTWEQEIDGPELRTFARFSAADGGATKVDLFATGGVGWTVNRNDLCGLALGIGRGDKSGHPVQAVLEGFYRWQPRPGFQVSPDLQILAGEGFDGSPGLRLVLGLRAGILF